MKAKTNDSMDKSFSETLRRIESESKHAMLVEGEVRRSMFKDILKECDLEFQKLSKEDSENLAYLSRHMGLVYYELNDLNSAEQALLVASNSIFMNVGTYSLLGKVYFKMRKFNQAINMFSKEISFHTKNKNSETHTNRGVAYFEIGKFNDAMNEFSVAIDRNISSTAFMNRSLVHVLNGNYLWAENDAVSATTLMFPDSINESLNLILVSHDGTSSYGRVIMKEFVKQEPRESELKSHAIMCMYVGEFTKADSDLSILRKKDETLSALVLSGDMHRLEGNELTAEHWYGLALKKFNSMDVQTTTDYLIAERIKQGVQRIPHHKHVVISKDKVIGGKNITESMVQNYLQMYR